MDVYKKLEVQFKKLFSTNVLNGAEHKSKSIIYTINFRYLFKIQLSVSEYLHTKKCTHKILK